MISEDIPTHDFNLPEPPKNPLKNPHPVVPVIGLGTKKNQRIKSFSNDGNNDLLQKGPIMRTQSEKTSSNPFLDFKRCGSIENLRAIQRGEHKNHFLSQNSNQTDKNKLENQFRINQKPFKPILQRSHSFTDLNQSLSSWRSPRLSVKRKELPFTLTVSNENLAALELDHDNESQKNSLESSEENDNNGEFTELQVEMVSITEENSSSVLSDILEEPTEIESSGAENDITEKSLESETLSSVESCIQVKIEPPEGHKKSEEDKVGNLTSESTESLSSEHQIELPQSKLSTLQPNEGLLPESYSSSASSTTNLPNSETIEGGSYKNIKLPESKMNTLQTDEKIDTNSLISSYTSDTQSKFENVVNDQNENDNKQFKLFPLFKNENTNIEHNNFLNNSIIENTNISSNPNLSVGDDILHKPKIGDETATEKYYLNQLDYLKSNKNNIFDAAEENNKEPSCNNNFIMDENSAILCDKEDQDAPVPIPRTITYEAPLDLAPAPGNQLPNIPTSNENTTNNNNISQQLESQETSEKEYEFNTIPPVKGSSKLDRDFSHNEFWKKFMERNNMEGMDELNVSSNYHNSSLKNKDYHHSAWCGFEKL